MLSKLSCSCFCSILLHALSLASPVFSALEFQQALPDPYIWLEDSESKPTQEWLMAQELKTKGYFESNRCRVSMKQNLSKILDFESYSIPIQCGNRLFYKIRHPSQDQPLLYVQDGIDGQERLLLDPNEGHTDPTSLSAFVPSPDGSLLAYGLAESGSDWIVWSVLDTKTGEKLSDRLEQIKFFPITWNPDSRGFYYSRFDDNSICSLYYHDLGTSQESDRLIYENKEEPENLISSLISSDHAYLLLRISSGSAGPVETLYRPLNDPSASFCTFNSFIGNYHTYLCNEDTQFYFWTNQDADFGKVVSLDLSRAGTIDIIPESDVPLIGVVSVGDYFLAEFSVDANSRLVLYNREGRKLHTLPFPEKGTTSFAAQKLCTPQKSDEIFISYSSFVQPPIIYRFCIRTKELQIFKSPRLPFDPLNYQIDQEFYPSSDGTQIPLFIVSKKGLDRDRPHQTLLYAYGGFGIALSPSFNPLHMAWIESGGVFALANIRGGSEYGHHWHEAGKRSNKQNCFDDFIAAAEWLIDHGYTNTSKIAIRGASNGGLLTAACLNQCPNLFGAALVEVGVLDMLRFHLFTVGRLWMHEYGNPDDPEDFKILASYSPYHNIKKDSSYPPVLIATGDHDDRVVPLHSYKYAAALQEAVDGKTPVLLRVGKQSGHGAGKSISQWVDEAADLLSFIKCSLTE